MTSPDVTLTSSGTINEAMRSASGIVEGGKDITATGTLKIPIVFVKFADDNATTSNWPTANSLPSWAANFVNSTIPTNNIYQNNNLSKFYDLSSGGNGSGTLGEFQVIGDVYFVSLSQNRSDFPSDGDVSEEVIDILDDTSGFDVDFSDYDNWQFKVGGVSYTHNNISDGILDFMLIYWKDKSKSLSSTVGGVAGLGSSYNTQTKDGTEIKYSNGVLGFKAQDFGNANTIWVTAHEIGHHQFGMINGNTGSHFNGRNDGYGQLQKFGLMTNGDGHQFSAYEKYRLGWLDPIIVTSSTSQTVTLNETHKGNTDNAVIIPIGYNASGDLEEYFLLENYHSTNAYSGANPFLTKSLFNHTISKGIIVYHVSEEDFDWPTLSQVDIESAEGLFDWDVIQGASTPSNRLDDLITPGDPNESSGFDERGNITAISGTFTYTDYLALRPESANNDDKRKRYRYNSDDYMGDQEDLFDINYNSVLTRWSNPSSRKDNGVVGSVGFEIVSYNSTTHQYIIKVAKNYTNVLSLAPSKPQNLQVVSNGSHPVVSWDANTEPDLSGYKLYRSDDNGPFQYIANLSKYTTSYVDNNVTFTKPIWEVKLVYKLKAKDTQNKYSVYSNSDYIYGDPGVAWKRSGNYTDEKVIVTTYELNQNYPNPFNPNTLLSYQIPENNYVNLTVYNSLGQTVAELVNKYQSEGSYSVEFDANNLPSGIYYYKIKAGEFTDVKKMILAK